MFLTATKWLHIGHHAEAYEYTDSGEVFALLEALTLGPMGIYSNLQRSIDAGEMTNGPFVIRKFKTDTNQSNIVYDSESLV